MELTQHTSLKAFAIAHDDFETSPTAEEVRRVASMLVQTKDSTDAGDHLYVLSERLDAMGHTDLALRRGRVTDAMLGFAIDYAQGFPNWANDKLMQQEWAARQADGTLEDPEFREYPQSAGMRIVELFDGWPDSRRPSTRF